MSVNSESSMVITEVIAVHDHLHGRFLGSVPAQAQNFSCSLVHMNRRADIGPLARATLWRTDTGWLRDHIFWVPAGSRLPNDNNPGTRLANSHVLIGNALRHVAQKGKTG